jgi:hypothetical protein
LQQCSENSKLNLTAVIAFCDILPKNSTKFFLKNDAHAQVQGKGQVYHSMEWYTCPFKRMFSFCLYVKAEEDDIAVLHDIILALRADQAFFFGSVHGAVGL